jgi:hypothetical protein
MGLVSLRASAGHVADADPLTLAACTEPARTNVRTVPTSVTRQRVLIVKTKSRASTTRKRPRRGTYQGRPKASPDNHRLPSSALADAF